MENKIEFKVKGRYALFTDPITKTGGEKFSYPIPTYEAIKGVVKSIYWKPTFIWYIDAIRVMKMIRMQTKSIKPIKWASHKSTHDLAVYTFLYNVEYQIQAHFEWNLHRPELMNDRLSGKHFNITRRALERGGRQDIFLGTRDCQAYVEPCSFGEDQSDYDNVEEFNIGLMFHGFDYPDETGNKVLVSRFWNAMVKKSIVTFPKPDDCHIKRIIRAMTKKEWVIKKISYPFQTIRKFNELDD